MFDIFKEVGKLNDDSKSSRLNAQIYNEKLHGAMELLKGFNSIASKDAKAERLVSSDTVLKTATINFGGKLVMFKMAFSCAGKLPYAIEIIELKEVKND